MGRECETESGGERRGGPGCWAPPSQRRAFCGDTLRSDGCGSLRRDRTVAPLPCSSRLTPKKPSRPLLRRRRRARRRPPGQASVPSPTGAGRLESLPRNSDASARFQSLTGLESGSIRTRGISPFSSFPCSQYFIQELSGFSTEHSYPALTVSSTPGISNEELVSGVPVLPTPRVRPSRCRSCLAKSTLLGNNLGVNDYGPWRRYVSASTSKVLPWEAPSRETLLRKIDGAMKDGNVKEALQSFGDYKKLHGLPEPRVLNSMIVSLSYMSNRRWLQRAFDMVLSVHQINSNLLNCGSLMRLASGLARDQMPVLASTVLRIILESGKLPDVDMLSMVFLHMLKSQVGSYLGADVLLETCESFLDQVTDRREMKKLDPIKNSATLFNMVLESCVNFKCIIKAQKIMELMSLVGVVADVNTVVIASRVFEMVGQRDELIHLKRSIDSLTYLPFLQYYQHFYDSLLSLHFKYNDMDAAAKFLIHLHQQREPSVFFCNGLQKQGIIQIGSGNLKTGYRIMFDPGKIDRGFVLGTESQFSLVILTDGNLLHTEKALAKLIVGCVKSRNIHTLSSLFIMLHKEDLEVISPRDVVNACIQMGWLHAAHDILDDLESAGIQVGITSYISLLRAYEKENKSEEFNGLLQQIQKIASTMDDIHTNSPFTIKNIAKIVKDEMPLTSSSLFTALAEEMKYYNPGEHMTLEFNNSILFFCKAKMMEDALCTYKRMREQDIRPTSHTFCHLLCGYSSMDMHREITMLWGEVKCRLEYGELDVDRDLLDCLILNFLKGGYFSRVMEVISYMSKHNIYCDKWKYRHVFLKLHKNLYRNLNSLHDKTEAQNKRIEDVRAFRSWAGIK